MSIDGVKALLDHAAGSATVPDDLVRRVVIGSHRRLRHRRILGVSLAAVVATASGGMAAVSWVDRGPAKTTVASTVGDPLLDRLNREEGRQFTVADLIFAGRLGQEYIVVVKRPANASEAEYGGKAAAVWAAPASGKPDPKAPYSGTAFRVQTDYLSYDFGCRNSDRVCAQMGKSPRGFAIVRQSSDGKFFVLATVPRGRSISVTTAEGTTTHFGDRAAAEVRTIKPWDLIIRVTREDGEQYELQLPPGGVVGPR